MLKNRLLLSASVLALTVAGLVPALAADITVSNGVTAGEQFLNDGDTLTVESGGAIDSAPGQHGVNTATNATVTISNAGSITGNVANAIRIAPDGTLTLFNSGTIDGSSYGVSARYVPEFVNTGSITGGVFGGVSIGLDAGTITNTGSIIGDDEGIYVGGNLANLSNSGTIRGAGPGIELGGDTTSIVNSGLIESTALDGILGLSIGSIVNETGGVIRGADHGINLSGTLTSLTNRGTIESSSDTALYASAAGSAENSGTIASAFGTGVAFDTLTGVFLNSGAITSGGAYAVYIDDLNVLQNTGTLTGAAGGVVSSINVNTLTNSGSITGTMQDGVSLKNVGMLDNLGSGTISGGTRGIWVQDAGMIMNAGSISAGANAIEAIAAIGSVVNSGSINAAGDYGITTGQLDSLVNSGTISGTMNGVYVANGTTVLDNSGTIHGSLFAGFQAKAAYAVNTGIISADTGFGFGADTIYSLYNSGTISGSTGGVAGDSIHLFTNSGLIRGATVGDYAIAEGGLGGVDTLLNLNAGSVLIGHVEISDGNDTLNVGKGLNLALTFDGSVPETINTYGMPYVVDGLTVHVADPSSVAPDAGATADLAGSIAGAVGNAIDPGLDELGAGDGRHYFLEAVGGVGGTPGAGGGSDMSHRYGGVVAGLGFMPEAGTRTGFFLGAAAGQSQAATSATDTSSFYGGVYASRQMQGYRLDGVLTAGYGNGDGARVIADNTSPTGLVTAASARDAFFLAPSLTVSKPFTFGQAALRSSFTVAYTGIFSKGFSETGTAAALSLEGGSTHVLEAKALVSLPNETTTRAGVVQADLHGGIETRAVFQSGGFSGSFGATPFALSDPDTRVTAGFTAGSGLRMKRGSMTFFANADAVIRTDSSYGLTARLGLKGAF